MNIKKNTQVST